MNNYHHFPNITIVNARTKDCPDFINIVNKDLEKIISTESGKRLIEKIGRGRHNIYIAYSKDNNLNITYKFKDDLALRCKRKKGCESIVSFNPFDDRDVLDLNEKRLTSPSFIKLAHELIHACHYSYGKCAKEEEYSFIDKNVWTQPEEYKTITGFKNTKITENRIRQEHGLPERFSHKGYISDEELKLLNKKLLPIRIIQNFGNEFPQNNQVTVSSIVNLNDELPSLNGRIKNLITNNLVK
jgi:Effector protein